MMQARRHATLSKKESKHAKRQTLQCKIQIGALTPLLGC